MQTYLLLCRSVTHAQRVNAALKNAGVRGTLLRPPVALTDKGCSHAVGVVAADFPFAMQQLRQQRLLPERVFLSSAYGEYREILLR